LQSPKQKQQNLHKNQKHMSASKIALVKELLDSAESNIRSAKQLLMEVAKIDGGTNISKLAETQGTKHVDPNSNQQIVEGFFDGQNMIGPDHSSYPVPANYASKSKIIPGDMLKLIITEDGSFIYKQIGPVDRKKIVGTLTYEDGQYKVLAEGKAYKVLLASVTYFKAEVGDKITIIVPTMEDSEWAAIENVLPDYMDEDE
jgi:hypothetical protein